MKKINEHEVKEKINSYKLNYKAFKELDYESLVDFRRILNDQVEKKLPSTKIQVGLLIACIVALAFPLIIIMAIPALCLPLYITETIILGLIGAGVIGFRDCKTKIGQCMDLISCIDEIIQKQGESNFENYRDDLSDLRCKLDDDLIHKVIDELPETPVCYGKLISNLNRILNSDSTSEILLDLPETPISAAKPTADAQVKKHRRDHHQLHHVHRHRRMSHHSQTTVNDDEHTHRNLKPGVR